MAKIAIIPNENDAPQIDSRPRIIVPLGKQKSGKSFFARWYYERLLEKRQRKLQVIDADPHNDTLARRFKDASTPGSSALEDRRIWLENEAKTQAKVARQTPGGTYDALWDIGGGDLLMARLAYEVKFTTTIERIGVKFIPFYLLGTDLSDLEYFQTLDDAGFRPERLGLVFNVALVTGGRDPARAFSAVMEAPLVNKLLERGAVPMFMPSLAPDCVEAVEKLSTATWREALRVMSEDEGLMWDAMRLESWLDDDMEREVGRKLDQLGWAA